MQYYLNQVCISYQELSAVIPKTTYDAYKTRNKITVLQKGGNGREALIAYNSLPEDIKKKVNEIYGSEVTAITSYSPLANLYEIDFKAHEFFKSYKRENGTHLSDTKINEYTANASTLNAIIRLLSKNAATRKSLGGKTKIGQIYINIILPSLQAFKANWGHTLPKSERQLREVINRFKIHGYEGIISGKDGNNNAAKIQETDQMALLRRLCGHGNNFDGAQVEFMYNEIAKANGWKSITRRTVLNYAEKNNLFTLGTKRGEVAFDNIMARQVKRKGPGYPLLFWSVDGWEVELLYQRTVTDNNGKNIQTYNNRATIIVVLDPFTKYPVGYAIGVQENSGLIKQAMRNALVHTRELFGCVHRPNQIQTDHYAMATLTPFYEAVSPRFTPAKVRNAKAKPIEPYFKYLNKNYCQFESNWSGFGVMARKESQPNAEFKNKIRHSLPDWNGLVKQIEAIVEKERKAKLEDFKAGFDRLPSEYKLTWNTEQYLYYAGEKKQRTTKLRGPGIVFNINRQEYTYDTNDIGFRHNAHVDWTICYDLQDMSNIVAASGDGTLRFLLQQAYIQPMALVERNIEDTTELAGIIAYNKQLKESVMEQNAKDYDLVNNLLRGSGNETLQKLLLVDSRGQHKDQLNASKRKEKSASISVEPIVMTETEQYRNYIESKVDINDYL